MCLIFEASFQLFFIVIYGGLEVSCIDLIFLVIDTQEFSIKICILSNNDCFIYFQGCFPSKDMQNTALRSRRISM